ncbi:MAG: hypothetical protein KJ799_15905 [Bacteroidetes bacterium]|nr:hypothetical protein [Bacteroidota bacterium]MBU2508184.1 hypothetical protein [Bacteroidota bacterium]
MKNVILCNNCSSENDFYKKSCDKCKAILRERVVNIDLWETIWRLFYEPKRAFSKIVWAEHKNFTIMILALLGMKFLINGFFINNLIVAEDIFPTSSLISILISFGLLLSLVIVFALILKVLLILYEIKTRLKDNIAVITYSFIPILFALVVLFPVEYALFGKHWIIFNPSPFFIRSSAAWLLSGIELILMIWSLVLLIIGVNVQSASRIFSIIIGVILTILLNLAFLKFVTFL